MRTITFTKINLSLKYPNAATFLTSTVCYLNSYLFLSYLVMHGMVKDNEVVIFPRP